MNEKEALELLHSLKGKDDKKFRYCPKCKLTKSIEDFKSPKDKITQSYCYKCTKAYSLEMYYLKRQAPTTKGCSICGREDGKLVLDHCHETNLKRGWLCYSCNIALGNFNDSIEILERAIAYLKLFNLRKDSVEKKSVEENKEDA
jgi:hypothetical protein